MAKDSVRHATGTANTRAHRETASAPGRLVSLVTASGSAHHATAIGRAASIDLRAIDPKARRVTGSVPGRRAGRARQASRAGAGSGRKRATAATAHAAAIVHATTDRRVDRGRHVMAAHVRLASGATTNSIRTQAHT